jgi:hypothetical protein
MQFHADESQFVTVGDPIDCGFYGLQRNQICASATLQPSLRPVNLMSANSYEILSHITSITYRREGTIIYYQLNDGHR